MRKCTPENLLPALRLFVEARNKANKSGFADNGGAIQIALQTNLSTYQQVSILA